VIRKSYQLLVIGAGPAGMAAAQTAASHGIDVALVDEQAQAGGQIYRNVDSSPLADISMLGKDYLFGRQIVQGFRHAHIDYFANSAVWYLDKSGEVGIVEDGVQRRVSAQRIVIACGAQERAMPFPGWDKAGVMTAGAGQILMKSAAMVPAEAPVLAGSGPLRRGDYTRHRRYIVPGCPLGGAAALAAGAGRQRLPVQGPAVGDGDTPRVCALVPAGRRAARRGWRSATGAQFQMQG
jgi:NADPH-dependent 2,4-dienoyl-CoA reductase/sulfur reductase-like enzyme